MRWDESRCRSERKSSYKRIVDICMKRAIRKMSKYKNFVTARIRLHVKVVGADHVYET
jgi:hypothetical protein